MMKKIVLSILIMTALNSSYVFSCNNNPERFPHVINLKLDTVHEDFDEKRITISNYEEGIFYKLPLDNSLQASGFIIKNGIAEFNFSDYKEYESEDDINPLSITAYKLYTSKPYFSKIVDDKNYTNIKVKLDEEMTFIVIDSTKNNTIWEDENRLTICLNK